MKYLKSLLYTLPAVAVLLFIAQKNHLLFDSLAELFSIVIIFAVFVISHLLKELQDRKAQVSEGEKFIRSVINSLTAHIAVLDKSGTIVMVNDAWRRFSVVNGGNPEQMSENTHYIKACENMGKSEYQEFRTRMQAVIDGTTEEFKSEYLCEAANGRMFHFLMRAVPLKNEHGGAVVAHYDISERKRLENHLQSMMCEQQIILENTSVGITFVKNRMQIWANPKMAEMFKYSPEVMCDLSTRLFYPSQEAFEQFGRAAYGALQQGDIYSSNCEMLRSDGTLFWTRVSGKAIDPADPASGSIWILEDITEQKSAEDAVILANNRLLEAQRLAHIGSWELDLKSGLLLWSNEIYRIFEIDQVRFGASYQAFLQAIHPDDRDQVNQAYSASLEKRSPYSIQHRLLMPDGRIKYVLEKCESIFDDAGKPLRSSGTVQDITELENARLAAEAASKVKSEFLANMSHEIRTPMNGILGMAQLLWSSPLTEVQKEQVDIIIMSASDLMRQINDILDFARMEAEQISLKYAPFSIRDCVREVLRAQSAHSSAKGLAVSVSTAEDVPESVSGDVYRVKQILVNLIGNAVKFTGEGEISVVISTVAQDEHTVVIELVVHDSGIGIPEQALEAIFQPFVQADSSINRKFGGTGLGLSISRSLVRRMGGEIFAENRPGGGSSFHLRLPCPLDQRIDKTVEEVSS